MKRKKRKKKGGVLIGMGLALIVAAAALCAYNLFDSFRAGLVSQAAVGALEEQIQEKQQSAASAAATFASVPDEMSAAEDPVAIDVRREVEIPDYVLNPNMEMPVSRVNGQDYIGILEIPAIDLKLSVISEWNYPRLRIAPCRYAGSAYTNNLVISAHNYASHFGSLSKLAEGTAVRFTDTDGNVFNYRVELKETLNPRDVEYMTDSGWDLSLFTCTPGGSYRATVRCTLVKSTSSF